MEFHAGRAADGLEARQTRRLFDEGVHVCPRLGAPKRDWIIHHPSPVQAQKAEVAHIVSIIVGQN
jgi:hypothetical protein